MSPVNPRDETHAALVRSSIADTARALEFRQIPFIEGVRKIAALRFELPTDVHEQDFMLFVGVASQADHIPNAEVRHLCASRWLEQCDQDASELETFYGEQVTGACRRLIERFSDAA
jgi:hypothetical protein